MFATYAEPGSDGFQMPLNSSETRWRTTPNQSLVTIEGRPYWTMNPKSDNRYVEEPLKWIPIRPGSYGASHIDYACNNR